MESVILQMQANELWLVIRWLVTVIFALLSFIGSFFIVSMWKLINNMAKKIILIESKLIGLEKEVEKVTEMYTSIKLVNQRIDLCENCNSTKKNGK